MAAGNPPFTCFLMGGGAGASYKDLEMIAGHGFISILRWKKFSKSNVIKTGKEIYFCTDFVPAHEFPHMGKIYSLQTSEKRMYSPYKVVYQRAHMPNRGKENALIFISFNAITQGLTALTAYKTSRIDHIKLAPASRDIYINSDAVLSPNISS